MVPQKNVIAKIIFYQCVSSPALYVLPEIARMNEAPDNLLAG
jgi:hypothetical protein